MKKKYLILPLLAFGAWSGKSVAQTAKCATDEMHQAYILQHPEIAAFEKKLNEDTRNFIAAKHAHGNSLGKTTATHADSDYYDIPVVVHVMHNYSNELLADNAIYGLIAEMNKFYSRQNDVSDVVAPFVKYIGNAKIRFHLATKDPNGNPTKGITHRFTYLTNGGDDQAKMDLWPPTNYYNIWFENYIGRGISGGTVLAYANFPSSAAAYPYNDGVIAGYQYINDGGGGASTLDHETGHYFNLYHTWNSSGQACGAACGDDEVDDTPPTRGNQDNCPLGETNCAVNYFKIYTNISGGDSLVNYPDTVNVQNVMNYASCLRMVSKGQVERMRACLNSNIGGRNNLWDSTNLAYTGALSPIPDLPPVTDFCARTGTSINYFTFPGVALNFFNKSWGDTVTAVSWTFTNGASPSTSLTNTNEVFTDPGWAKLTMTATGNNSGTTTTVYDHAAFVADVAGTPAPGYMQEFAAGGDRDKWPMFNYYNNEFKWQLTNVGFYDSTSVMYEGFDSRYNPLTGSVPHTGTPRGDYDDLFSIPVDLSAYSTACNLDFYYSAASRSSNSLDINDTLLIDYSKNKGAWVNFAKLAKSSLINKGAYPFYYVPDGQEDWSPKTIAIPTTALGGYTTFRFRYKPYVGQDGENSSGNNFYMDRITFSPLPAGVNDVNLGIVDVAVVPNPTSGDAYVVIKDAVNASAHIVVSDITGKVVYTVSQQANGKETQIRIPHSAIQVQGVYLVQTTTGSHTQTQKLVVY